MKIFQRLINDERGAIMSIELVLLATLTVFGLMVGMAAFRDAIFQELGDAAAGVSNLQQSFSIDAVVMSGSFGDVPYEARTEASNYVDTRDFCETNPDLSGQPPMCMQVIPASVVDEGTAVLVPSG